MTLSQINYFIVAANEGSITRAANSLFVSQPSVSKSISSLERELGFPLFVRRDNAIVLTYAGRQLFDFFTQTRSGYHRLLNSIQRDTASASARLRLGCSSAWNPEMFCGKIQDYFSQHYPSIHLAIDCFPVADMTALLRSKHLDAILTYALFEGPAPHEFASRQIAATERGLLYSRRYFPQLTSIDQFRDMDFLVYESGVRRQVEDMIRDACQGAFEPRIKNCGDYGAAVFEMTRGTGAMLFEGWDSIIRSQLFRFFSLKIPLPINAVYRTDDTNPNLAIFLDAAQRLFQDADPLPIPIP